MPHDSRRVSPLLDVVKSALRGKVRLVNFFLVGALNTVFGYGVFALMLWLGLHYTVAIAVATVLGTLFNFKSTGALVFRSRDNTRVFRFVLVYVVIYCVNVLGVGALLRLNVNSYYGGLAMIIPLALLSYWLNSKYVFDC